MRPAIREAASALRHGSLQFVDEDLSIIVVAILNRYRRHELIITDRSLGGLRYVSTFIQGRETECLAASVQVLTISVQRCTEA